MKNSKIQKRSNNNYKNTRISIISNFIQKYKVKKKNFEKSVKFKDA